MNPLDDRCWETRADVEKPVRGLASRQEAVAWIRLVAAKEVEETE